MILLDTHAVLWWQAGGERLSARVAREIARADAVFVSPVSCWEVATLLRLGRISLDRELALWVRDLFAQEQVSVAPLSPEAAAYAGSMGDFHGDPADRLLYATARELVAPLATKDSRIRSYASSRRGVRTIW